MVLLYILLTADRIVINTGAKSNIPSIPGIESAKHLFDSQGLLNISYQQAFSNHWWRAISP